MSVALARLAGHLFEQRESCCRLHAIYQSTGNHSHHRCRCAISGKYHGSVLKGKDAECRWWQKSYESSAIEPEEWMTSSSRGLFTSFFLRLCLSSEFFSKGKICAFIFKVFVLACSLACVWQTWLFSILNFLIENGKTNRCGRWQRKKTGTCNRDLCLFWLVFHLLSLPLGRENQMFCVEFFVWPSCKRMCCCRSSSSSSADSSPIRSISRLDCLMMFVVFFFSPTRVQLFLWSYCVVKPNPIDWMQQ